MVLGSAIKGAYLNATGTAHLAAPRGLPTVNHGYCLMSIADVRECATTRMNLR